MSCSSIVHLSYGTARDRTRWRRALFRQNSSLLRYVSKRSNICVSSCAVSAYPCQKVNHHTAVLCDNESVVKSTTNVESTLNKKHSSVAYHHSKWSVAAGVITLAHISTHDNIADCFTKRLPLTTRMHLFGQWTF
jgi:hypothetical protein